MIDLGLTIYRFHARLEVCPRRFHAVRLGRWEVFVEVMRPEVERREGERVFDLGRYRVMVTDLRALRRVA